MKDSNRLFNLRIPASNIASKVGWTPHMNGWVMRTVGTLRSNERFGGSNEHVSENNMQSHRTPTAWPWLILEKQKQVDNHVRCTLGAAVTYVDKDEGWLTAWYYVKVILDMTRTNDKPLWLSFDTNLIDRAWADIIVESSYCCCKHGQYESKINHY